MLHKTKSFFLEFPKWKKTKSSFLEFPKWKKTKSFFFEFPEWKNNSIRPKIENLSNNPAKTKGLFYSLSSITPRRNRTCKFKSFIVILRLLKAAEPNGSTHKKCVFLFTKRCSRVLDTHPLFVVFTT